MRFYTVIIIILKMTDPLIKVVPAVKLFWQNHRTGATGARMSIVLAHSGSNGESNDLGKEKQQLARRLSHPTFPGTVIQSHGTTGSAGEVKFSFQLRSSRDR